MYPAADQPRPRRCAWKVKVQTFTWLVDDLMWVCPCTVQKLLTKMADLLDDLRWKDIALKSKIKKKSPHSTPSVHQSINHVRLVSTQAARARWLKILARSATKYSVGCQATYSFMQYASLARTGLVIMLARMSCDPLYVTVESWIPETIGTFWHVVG